MNEASPIEWLPAPPDDHEYDDPAEQAFYRRLPLVVDSVLRAWRLDAIVTSIVRGAEYLCPGAAVRLDNLDPAAVSEDAVAMRGGPLAVILIDADGLRVVNNTIGYHAGDALISLLADAVRTAAAGHFVARLGGDEFVVLVEGDRAARAEKLCAAIAGTFDPSPLAPEIRALRPGASAGAVVAANGELPREVLRRAGERMHAEKRRRKADRARIE